MKTSGELRNDFYKWLDDNPDGRVWDWMHKILKEEKSNQVEAQVSDANSDKIMDVILKAEEYYKNLLETDYENRDYSACWVCQIKLQLLDELEFDIDSCLSR